MKCDQLEKVIRDCQNGKSDAFAGLLNQFGTKLFRFFLRNTGSREDAQDLLQEVFIKLLENIKGYRHKGRFESWLFIVAANLLRDHYRKRNRRIKTHTLESDYDPEGRKQSEPVAPNPLPQQELEKHEQLDRLQQALMILTPLDREIVMLRHYGGLTFQELAEHFKIPLGTALAKVHRSLKKLRKNMKNE